MTNVSCGVFDLSSRQHSWHNSATIIQETHYTNLNKVVFIIQVIEGMLFITCICNVIMLKITRENDAVFYPRKEKTLLDTLTTTMYARQRAITRLVYITLTHQDTEKGHHSL